MGLGRKLGLLTQFFDKTVLEVRELGRLWVERPTEGVCLCRSELRDLGRVQWGVDPAVNSRASLDER